jgi:hypothetical protein
MDFRFFHAALAGLVAEKLQDRVQRLLRVVQYVGERSPLTILAKIPSCDYHLRHVLVPCKPNEDEKSASANIVSAIRFINKAGPARRMLQTKMLSCQHPKSLRGALLETRPRNEEAHLVGSGPLALLSEGAAIPLNRPLWNYGAVDG